MPSKIIRVALVGLSANATTSWAAAAHLPYLQSAQGQTQYKIVALLNSSKEAAETARSHFNLPSTVKAYGDPAQLAADDEVDLVSVVTRVDKHYSAAEPSIRAGKSVYVEWPLTESLKRSVALVGENKGRDTSIIGLQGRLSPVASKVKEVLASGRLGKVLDSQVRGTEDMFTQRAIGGNHFSILYAHMIDLVHSVLGEFKDFQSKLQIRWPEVEIVDKDGVKVRTRQSDIPDLITAQGELAPGIANIQEGATLSAFFRSGPTFKGELPYTWYIQGEKGELKITSPIGPILQAATVPAVKIELHDAITDEVIEIPWESEWKDFQKELQVPGGKLVGEMYNRYAQWYQQSDKAAAPVGGDWPRLEDAIRRHEELDKMLSDFDKSK
ncbi:oxidoreductase family, NAD-binding rossmann fold domain-containing protein [Trichoderma breve]|uniref:Oxidoreductase family, NAD-binding rossmann fold domain-containing protein n=1 Tax=Trichoderma breve TaxID=2034170 RepID=A0A9W9B531_9HYPO|nr:oxidoreductase family, NAD-binding rossmann fold domain-containing protein [Trichoderma breve]KAJ4855977.1 oxidoreductase family, NAD-binding rossmann fold domain-containing protein [Trichoderma breve]